MTEKAGLTIRPLEEARFGAEILGLVPREITDAQREAIWEVYRDRHGLICFAFDYLIEEDELHLITTIFGEKEVAPGLINGMGKMTPKGEEHLTFVEQIAQLEAEGIDPYMTFLGNLDPKTLKRMECDKKFFGEWEWHSDMSYIPVPPTFSLLHARIIPEEGGDTGFCSQVMAAKTHPSALRARVVNLTAKHDSTFGSNGELRPGMSLPASPVEAMGHTHPILRKVPATGDEAIYVGRRTNGYIPGHSLEESEALLDEIWAHATQAQFCYRHKWQVGQVVVWDNRMLIHMRHPVDQEQNRFMWRTQTKGEAVIPV